LNMAMLIPAAVAGVAGGSFALRRLFTDRDAEEKAAGTAEDAGEASVAAAEGAADAAEEKAEGTADDAGEASAAEGATDAADDRGASSDDGQGGGASRSRTTGDGEEQSSQAAQMIKDAVALYKHRGYTGTIAISHKVGIFTETCSLGVRGDDVHKPAAVAENEADAPAGTVSWADSTASRAFDGLLARLERRAIGWDTFDSDVDPVLGASASVGLNLPVIKLGWGFTISLSITKSSLLRWARRGHASSKQTPTDPRQAPPHDHTAALAAASEALLRDD